MNDSQSRLSEQCFLISFIDEFVKLNGRARDAQNVSEEAEAQFEQETAEQLERGGGVEADDFEMHFGSKLYQNFVCMMTKNPSSMINRLVTDRGLQQLFNLTPAHMAAVMPKIKFYKMRYSGPNDRTGTPIEFKFGGSYTRDDIQSMIDTKQGRGGGVGIKSFEWKLLGTNSAEVDNNIKATLKIYFQNFKDFVNEEVLQTVRATPIPRGDDDSTSEPEEQENLEDVLDIEKANFLDLIFRAQKFGSGSNRDTFNEKYYRIKAICGWSVDPQLVGGEEGNPTPAAGKLFSPDLKEKIESVGTTLLLSLLSHDIDFREDGTIELTLDYHAAVESMLTSSGSNILYPSTAPATGGLSLMSLAPNFFAALASSGIVSGAEFPQLSAYDVLSLLDRRDRELDEEMQEEESRQSSEDTPPATGDAAAEDDECYTPYGERTSEETGLLGMVGIGHDVEQQIEADQTEARVLRRALMYNIYNNLLREIQQQHMYYIDAPAVMFGEGPAADGFIESTENLFSTLPRGAAGSGVTEQMDAYRSELQDEMSHDEGGQSASQQAAALAGEGAFDGNVIPTAQGAGWTAATGPVKRIYYFYMGDLIDTALELLKSDNNPEEFGDIRLVLGTIFMNMPSARGGNTILVNIADIPISLNLFIQFFTDRVIARARTEWPLREFIRECMSRLVYPAMGSGCAERPSSPRPNVDIVHVSAYGDDEGSDRLLTAGTPPRVDFSLNPNARTSFGLRRIFDNEIAPLGSSSRLVDRNLFHYVLIMANNFNNSGRNAMDPESPQWDAAEGIYWLNIGNDKGLVRSIKFKKTDQPGLRESRMEREGTIGLGQLRDKYDADVSMFGNSLFQPGQLIYINPTVIGLHAPGYATHLSSILGIGGYHQIISVDNAISDSTYETILNTKWVASGTGRPEEQDEECND